MYRIKYLSLFMLAFIFSSCLREFSKPIEPSVLRKLKLLPAEPINVIYFNLKNIRSNKYWKGFFNDEINVQNQLSKTIFDSLGIDFQTDVDEIIFATEWNDLNTFIITLDKASIGKIRTVKLKDFYYLQIDDRDLFITNDSARIEKIKNKDYNLSFINHTLFRRMVNSILYKDYFWFLTQNKAPFLKLLKNGNSNDQEFENLFRSINFINFSLKLDKNMSINSHWDCVDSYKANLLEGVLNGIISMLALTEPNDPLVNELSKSDIYISDKGVKITFELTKNRINQIRQSIFLHKLKKITEHGHRR